MKQTKTWPVYHLESGLPVAVNSCSKCVCFDPQWGNKFNCLTLGTTIAEIDKILANCPLPTEKPKTNKTN
jgi:hypothetical protein